MFREGHFRVSYVLFLRVNLKKCKEPSTFCFWLAALFLPQAEFWAGIWNLRPNAMVPDSHFFCECICMGYLL